jgi:hypothetical protein
MFRNLTPDQRERTFSHPEYGALTVWWIAARWQDTTPTI